MRRDKKFYSVVVGPEEHKRVRIMAAHESTTISDFVRGLINETWDRKGRMLADTSIKGEKHHGKEQRV